MDGENCTISNYLFSMNKNIENTITTLYLTQATQIDGLANINTGKFTSMGQMFNGFTALTSIDLSSFNTRNVTDFDAMFYNCKSLTTLDVSSFNTSNATDLSGMFYNCKGLTTLDVSSFSTNNVIFLGYTFGECTNLKSIIGLEKWNTSNVDNMRYMFAGLLALTSLDVSHFNTGKVTEMDHMFWDCRTITSLDLTNFDVRNVIYIGGLFDECKNLTTIYCNEDWSVTLPESAKGNYMFAFCSKLKGEMGTEWNSANPDDKTYARPDKGPDQPGYFTTK